MKNDLINFFINENNKSGWKTNSNILRKRFPSLYENIINYCTINGLDDISFKQKIFHYIYEKEHIPICQNCPNKIKFGRSLKEGYNKYCSLSCTNKNKEHINKVLLSRDQNIISEKIKKTTLEKYGVDNIFKDKDYIKQKIYGKYGVYNITQLPEIISKIKNTNIERYGVHNTFLLPNIKELAKEGIIKKYGVDHYSKTKEYKLNKFKNNISTLKDKFIELSDDRECRMLCSDCNKEYTISCELLTLRKNRLHTICLHCNPMFGKSVSSHEKELYKFIKSVYDGEIIKKDRKILGGKELDIVLPEKKLAIEFNGIYYHNELFIDKDYHLNKTLAANKNGYSLIHIFEDEWVYNKDICKSIISSKLGYSNKIYARKCIIKEITNKDYKKFIDDNHIQGYIAAKIKIGLFYNEELVSVMSFGSMRTSLGSKNKEDEYELLRLCNKLGYTVTGGSDKMFKFFIKTYNPLKVTTYSDIRWFNGNVYKNMGFTYIESSKPNYWYIIKNIRKHRFGFRKDILIKEGYDKNKTERSIMMDREIYRIYDCGNMKYIWNLSETL